MKSALILSYVPMALAAVISPVERRQEGGHSHSNGGSPSGGMAAPGGMGGLGSLSGLLGGKSGGGRSALGSLSALAIKFLPSQKAFKIEKIPPVLRPEATRIKVTYGPYKLKGVQTKERVGNSFSMDPAGTAYMYSLGDDFPRDITLLDGYSLVYDENMKPIDRNDGLYNHHNVFVDVSSPPIGVLGCGDGKAFASVPVNVFIGGAADSSTSRYTSNDGKFNSGLYLAKDAGLMQMIDIVNYTNNTKVIYTISEMEYLPGKPEGLLNAYNVGVDIGMCASKSGMNIHPPKGQAKFQFAGKELTIERDGYFLNMHGHMHDGGSDVVVKINGKQVCYSKALYGGEGHEGVSADGKPWKTLRELSVCEEPIKVSKGDKLAMVANFDLDEHPARAQSTGGMAEEMAVLVSTFAG